MFNKSKPGEDNSFNIPTMSDRTPPQPESRALEPSRPAAPPSPASAPIRSTNLSTLTVFTWKLALIDMAWGATASALASAAGAAVARV